MCDGRAMYCIKGDPLVYRDWNPQCLLFAGVTVHIFFEQVFFYFLVSSRGGELL